MKLQVALKLARISNLPTLWTNVLVGSALVSTSLNYIPLLITFFAMSMVYIAGMFLNDAFDREWDRQHQNNRPLVRGQASVKEVYWISITLLLSSLALLFFLTDTSKRSYVISSTLVLITLVFLYNYVHKKWNPSVWIMGSCRFMVYFCAALTVGSINNQLIIAGISLLSYIAGITYLARQEHLNSIQQYWPIALLFSPVIFLFGIGYNHLSTYLLCAVLIAWLVHSIKLLVPGENRKIPKAIGKLLAGIALIDACILVSVNQYFLAATAAIAFYLCLLLQQKIPAS